MAEPWALDPFEQRFTAELQRYVAPATDRRPASAIAEVAMRPRGLEVGARNGSRLHRFLVLGLAAAFLLPAAYVLAGGFRAPVPDLFSQLPPERTHHPRPTAALGTPMPSGSTAIFVRRERDADPGVSVFAVRPDGGEVLVRKLRDSILPGRGRWSEWGSVSGSGWLALGMEEVTGGSWPLVLVDLGDDDATPWVIDEADLGGIGPSWGPTGLVAAFASPGSLVIADPETRTTRMVSMQGHSLVGGGPSILWSADGSGIVGSTGSGAYEIVPLDGGDPVLGVALTSAPRRGYGLGLAELRICSENELCSAGDDGRVERVEVDGSAQTVWQQETADRALAASFGDQADEYWLSLDRNHGRQVALVHIRNGRQDGFATVNRDAGWQYVSAPIEAPDQSTVLIWTDSDSGPAAVVVPLDGAAQTFHPGHFAGFVESAASATFATGPYRAPSVTVPPVGEPYALPSLRELIDAQPGSNPRRRVLGKASRDGVEGDTDVRTVEVRRDQPGAGKAHLDCRGPSGVTVTSGSHSFSNPCLASGSYIFPIDKAGPVTVTASGETSWRVVIYIE